MPFHVYILKCADGSLYVGSTADLAARIHQHNDGRGGRYTSSRGPVTLLYSEAHPSLQAAVQRERQIKPWTHAKKQALVDGRLADLKRLAVSRQSRRLRAYDQANRTDRAIRARQIRPIDIL